MNRIKIRDMLIDGVPPDEIILAILADDPSAQARQYGIVDTFPSAAGFTGEGAGWYRNDVTNEQGTLVVAVQGNVLTGWNVIGKARNAVLDTEGSLADKLMAAMEEARFYGGDGRCSCSVGAPMSCGAPPEDGFTKSAHCAFMIVARIGDTDSGCGGQNGCAQGDYYLDFNIANQTWANPDPVFQLRDQYEAWKAERYGRPDGILSITSLDDPEVLGDGTSVRTIRIALHDLQGEPITEGGQTVTAVHAPDSAGLSTIGTITDLGNGAFEIEVMAGQGEGIDEFQITVDDGSQSATLYPFPSLVHRLGLQSDALTLSASGGRKVNFDLLGPGFSMGRRFLLMLSPDGTEPGYTLPSGEQLPLNVGRWLDASLVYGGHPLLQGGHGLLDASGRATVTLTVDTQQLAPLIGLPLAAAWMRLRPIDYISNPVEIVIEP